MNRFAPRTHNTYKSHVRKFFSFCVESEVDPLQLTDAQKEDYIAYLTLTGVQATSAPQYLSGLNSTFVAHGFPPPYPPNHPSRRLLIGARRIHPPGHPKHQPLQPWVVLRILQLGLTSDDRRIIQTTAAIIICICFGFRSHTYATILCQHVRCSRETISIDIDAEKSWTTRNPRRPKRTIVYARTEDNAAVFHLLQKFLSLRGPSFPSSAFFSLPEDPPSLAHDELNFLVKDFMRYLDISTPGYDGHALRHTFSSMTRSIGVSLEKVCYVGGWSSKGDAVHTYIDSTYPFHPISSLLFNGLLPPPFRYSVPASLLGPYVHAEIH